MYVLESLYGNFRSELTFNGYRERDVHVVVSVDEDVFHDHLQKLFASLGGQLAQTLTASPSGIANANGLTNMVYSYKWLANDTEIEGETSSTNTLQASVNGKVVTVRVAFTDDDGLYLGVCQTV